MRNFHGDFTESADRSVAAPSSSQHSTTIEQLRPAWLGLTETVCGVDCWTAGGVRRRSNDTVAGPQKAGGDTAT